jgi:hypothetical protein
VGPGSSSLSWFRILPALCWAGMPHDVFARVGATCLAPPCGATCLAPPCGATCLAPPCGATCLAPPCGATCLAPPCGATCLAPPCGATCLAPPCGAVHDRSIGPRVSVGLGCTREVLRCSGSSRRPTTARSRPRRATRPSSSLSVFSWGGLPWPFSAVRCCAAWGCAISNRAGLRGLRRCMLRSALVTLWCASCIGLFGACTTLPAAPNDPAVTVATSSTGLGLTPATSARPATSSARAHPRPHLRRDWRKLAIPALGLRRCAPPPNRSSPRCAEGTVGVL